MRPRKEASLGGPPRDRCPRRARRPSAWLVAVLLACGCADDAPATEPSPAPAPPSDPAAPGKAIGPRFTCGRPRGPKAARRALERACETVELVQARMRDAVHGGYHEATDERWRPLAEGPRRQNPHMHWVEALLAAAERGDPTARPETTVLKTIGILPEAPKGLGWAMCHLHIEAARERGYRHGIYALMEKWQELLRYAQADRRDQGLTGEVWKEYTLYAR